MPVLSRSRAQSSGWIVATLLVLVFPGLILAGCDFVDSPERFVDDTVQPPVVASVDYATVRSGQHLAGTVVLTANLDSLAGRVDYVALLVDGQEIDNRSDAPYTLHLPTDQFPDGPKTIGLAIYKRDATQGLLGIAGVPATTLLTPVVFDQTPPSQVETLSGTWSANGVELTWAPSQDLNFYAYLVIREDTWSDAPDGGSGFGINAVVLDTLFDASVTTYEDPAPPPVYGLTSTYRVAVSNRASVVPSTELALSYGSAASIPGSFVYSGTYHPTRDLAYQIDGSNLTVWSLADGTILKTVDLSAFVQTPELAQAGYVAGIRTDGTELYVYASDPASLIETSELLVFSATADPTFLRRLSAFPNDAFRVRTGPGALLTARVDSAFRLYDTANGQLQTTLSGVPSGATVHRAGARILTQHLNDARAECVLTSYNPTTGDSVSRTTYPFDGMSCWNVYVADGGSTMYLVSSMESRFRKVDGASFEITGPIDVPVASGERVDRVAVRGDRLFLGVTSSAAPYQSGAVLELESDGETVVRTWRFAPTINRVLPSADGTALYVFSYDAPSTAHIWRVPREN